MGGQETEFSVDNDLSDSDYEAQIEPFYSLGLAVAQAQLFEQGVVTLAVALRTLDPASAKKKYKTLGDVYTELDRMPLGVLIKDRVGSNIEQHESAILRELLEKRNYLIHRFWVVKGHKWPLGVGKKDIINELRRLATKFAEGDALVTRLYQPLWTRLGVDEVSVRKEVDRLATQTSSHC